MADDVTFQSDAPATPPAGTKVSADEDSSNALIQRVKLAYSADGSRTHVQADADGVLVNLGANNDVTVAGVSTLAEQQTQTGHLATIAGDTTGIETAVESLDTKTPALGQALAAASVPVVLPAAQITTLTPPSVSGLATHAKQDAAKAVLDTIDADTSVLAAAVDGTEVQVDVVGSLPAGTNNIGDVDVLSLPATPTGDNTIGRVKITDGTDVADVLDLTNANPVAVAIVDGNGDQVTGFGGGTQYTEGDTDSSITGTAVLWEDASETLRPVSAAKPLPVEIISGAGSGGTAADDDADFTAGTTSGTPAMGVYESSPTSVTDGDLGVVGITQTRALRTAVEGSVAVTHAALTELAAAIDTEVQVDVVSSALPSGASSLAEQQTQTTHLATIAGDTTDIEAAVELLDDTVATLGTTTYSEATTKGLIIGAVRRDADTTLVDTTNEVAPLQVDANGRLKVEAFSGETLPVSLASVPSHAVTNAGTFPVQVDGAALTALQLIDDGVFTDDTSTHSTGSSKGYGVMAVATPSDGSVNANDFGHLAMTTDRKLHVSVQEAIPGTGATSLGKAVDSAAGATDTGVAALAVRDDALATLTPADADYTHLRTNTRGALWVQQDAPPTGSTISIAKNIDVDETEDAIKASAGTLWGYTFFNAAATTHYLKFYNATTGNVTVGTTVPDITIALPAGAAGHINFDKGIPFSTAITVAATTGIADNDSGAPAANAVSINAFYT